MRIQHVELTGAPYEIGMQHGGRCATLVRDVVDHYGRYEAASPRVQSMVRTIETTLAETCPQVLREIQGIAAGVGLPVEDILYLNTVFDAAAGGSPPHRCCTAIGLPRTPDGPLVAKTDDVALDERSFETFFRVEPDRGHAFMYYAFAGTVWNQGGINGAGLAVAMTGLSPAGEVNLGGIPSLILLRQLLVQCRGVGEAVAYIRGNPPRVYGCSITLADGYEAEITLVENYPAVQGIRTARARPTVHTNHPVFGETLELMVGSPGQKLESDPEFARNSHSRYENAQKLVGQVPHSVDGLKALLGDHAERGAICQHGQAGLHTSAAMILIPRRRAIVAAEGYGCEPYVEHVL